MRARLGIFFAATLLSALPATASPVLLGTNPATPLCCAGLGGFMQASMASHFTFAQPVLVDELTIQGVLTFEIVNSTTSIPGDYDLFLTKGIGPGAVTLASAQDIPSGTNFSLPLNLILTPGNDYYVVISAGLDSALQVTLNWPVSTVLPGGLGSINPNVMASTVLVGAENPNPPTAVFATPFVNSPGLGALYQLHGSTDIVQQVPEPASVLLLGAGAFGVIVRRWRRSGHRREA